MVAPKGAALFPNRISHQSLQSIADFVSGKPSKFDLRPTSLGQLTLGAPGSKAYADANRFRGQLGTLGGKALSAGFIDASKLSPQVAGFLNSQKNMFATGDVFGAKGVPQGTFGSVVNGKWVWPTYAPPASFTQNDFDIIRAGSQKIVDQDRLYYNDLLRRVQEGSIKVDVPKQGLFSKVLTALPAIAGAAFGGPIGGAIGGAISGGISGGGLKGALTGAVGGGIAGAGGIGSVAGKALGSTSAGGGLMNSITSGLRSVANSSFNPFGSLGGSLQGLFGVNPVTTGLGSALSLGGPGALLGGALGGKQGALLGGLGGAGLGLGLDGYLGNLFGGGGNIFGGGGGGGGLLGGSGGAGGLLGGLFGGNLGGLGQLLAGGVPLAMLTREAEKASNTPTGSRTPFSSVNNGVASLDPNIRNVLLESIGNTRGELGRARGNQNAFIQARVNPLQEQIGQQRGALQRSIGLRGLSGSSFGDQAMRSFGLDSERALGDARSQATQEALGFESQLNQLLAQGGSQLLTQELAGLGLGDQNIARLLERAKLRTDLFGRAASQFGSLLGGG